MLLVATSGIYDVDQFRAIVIYSSECMLAVIASTGRSVKVQGHVRKFAGRQGTGLSVIIQLSGLKVTRYSSQEKSRPGIIRRKALPLLFQSNNDTPRAVAV